MTEQEYIEATNHRTLLHLLEMWKHLSDDGKLVTEVDLKRLRGQITELLYRSSSYAND